MTSVRLATDAEIDEVLTWTHAEWGVSDALPAYQARTRRFLGTPWGRERYRFHVAADAAGQLVAACKLYTLDMVVEGREGHGIGFGAVFTRNEARGQGHASRMLLQLSDQAKQDGALLALLFSDIGPEMYAKLGYVDLGVREGYAAATPGPAPFRPWNGPMVAGWARGEAIALPRSADYRAYLLMRGECEVLAWVPDGEPAGFVLIDPDDDEHLWVEEAGVAPGHDPARLWTDLRALAAERGRPDVGAWVPPEAEGVGYVARPLAKPLAMAKPLALTGVPFPVHLWSIDHF